MKWSSSVLSWADEENSIISEGKVDKKEKINCDKVN